MKSFFGVDLFFSAADEGGSSEAGQAAVSLSECPDLKGWRVDADGVLQEPDYGMAGSCLEDMTRNEKLDDESVESPVFYPSGQTVDWSGLEIQEEKVKSLQGDFASFEQGNYDVPLDESGVEAGPPTWHFLKKLIALSSILLFLSLVALLFSFFSSREKGAEVSLLAAGSQAVETESGESSDVGPADSETDKQGLIEDQGRTAGDAGKWRATRHTGSVGERGQHVEDFPVYICGEVRQPGVVRLKAGSYLEEAIQACGGFTDQADRQAVNLAMEMRANIMIDVPALGADRADRKAPEGYVDSLAAEPLAGELRRENESSGKVNINWADREELLKIPGVGRATAEKILSYRQEVGRFNSIEDLMQVPGIKSGKFESMREAVCVN